MDNVNERHSDAEWYFCQDPETDRYYDIFFAPCRKYDIQWPTATEKEKALIIALTTMIFDSGGDGFSVFCSMAADAYNRGVIDGMNKKERNEGISALQTKIKKCKASDNQ